MSKQTINIGASPNDGTGTPLRTSFDYTNQNFTELYTALGGGVGLPGATTQVIFNDGGTNLAGDAGLVYNKTTDTLTAGNATITGAATVGTTLGVTGVSTFASSISAVNDATVSGTGRLTLGSASGNAGARLDLRGWSTANANWRLSSALYGAGLDFTPSTTAGGTTFTTPAFSMLSSGDLSMALGNVVMATPGKGIDFSATASGSGTMTSELLNDYEEGVFTPTVVGTTAAGTASYSRRLGRYTKVGNLVTIQIYLAWSAGAGGLGNLAFIGLPFNIANNANEYAVATIGFLDSVALTALNTPTIIGAANSTMLEMWQFPVGGGVSSQVPYDADGSIILTSTYVAA
jgi:hypothetical protein